MPKNKVIPKATPLIGRSHKQIYDEYHKLQASFNSGGMLTPDETIVSDTLEWVLGMKQTLPIFNEDLSNG